MSSKRAQRRRACTGKRPYPTFATAQAAAWRSARDFGGRWSAYPCSFCHAYHSGHTPKAVLLAVAAARRAA